MKLLILNLISTCLFTPCIAQLSKPVTVTYEFIKVSTNLINSRPVNIQLTTDDISYYFRQDYHNRDKISKTDSLILVEMITNKITIGKSDIQAK